MRSDEVVKKDIDGDQTIGRIEGTEPSCWIIPGFELVVESFDEVIRDQIMKVLDPNMQSITEVKVNRLDVSFVSIRNSS